MNEFFNWNMRHGTPWDTSPPLTNDEHDELFELMNDPAIPEAAFSIEMADGYMTACVVGPMPVPVHEWLETIFQQPTLPFPDDGTRQHRLLTLLLRRYRDIDTGTSLGPDDATPDNIFLPLTAQVPEQERVTPYQLDAHGERVGEWKLHFWAEGFRHAVSQDDAWDALISDRDMSALLAPVVQYSLGHNPDHPDIQIDGNEELLGHLIGSVCAMRNWWKAYRRGEVGSVPTFLRDTPKVGRNDACPCGSGKKYKKCCGA